MFSVPPVGLTTSFFIDVDLAYTPSQTIIVSPDLEPINHFHSTIETYIPSTGYIMVSVTEVNNISGVTYSAWQINLSGAVGVPGPQGATGPLGNFGGDSVLMTMENYSFSSGGISGGYIGFNGTNVTNTTQLDISNTDAQGGDITNWNNALVSSTNAVKGSLRISVNGSSNIYVDYQILSGSNSTGREQLVVVYIGSNGTINPGDSLVVSFARSGDLGAAGQAGTQGATGPSIGSFGGSFDGMGSVVLVNSRTFFRIPRAGTITGWSIVAEGTSPTATFDVWKIASGTALPTVANTIFGTKPALATGSAITSTTMAGWTTSFADNDIFAINVDACVAATKLQLLINVTYS